MGTTKNQFKRFLKEKSLDEDKNPTIKVVFKSLAQLTTEFNQWATKYDEHTSIGTLLRGHTRWLKVCINKHVMRKWAKEFKVKIKK